MDKLLVNDETQVAKHMALDILYAQDRASRQMANSILLRKGKDIVKAFDHMHLKSRELDETESSRGVVLVCYDCYKEDQGQWYVKWLKHFLNLPLQEQTKLTPVMYHKAFSLRLFGIMLWVVDTTSLFYPNVKSHAIHFNATAHNERVADLVRANDRQTTTTAAVSEKKEPPTILNVLLPYVSSTEHIVIGDFGESCVHACHRYDRQVLDRTRPTSRPAHLDPRRLATCDAAKTAFLNTCDKLLNVFDDTSIRSGLSAGDAPYAFLTGNVTWPSQQVFPCTAPQRFTWKETKSSGRVTRTKEVTRTLRQLSPADMGPALVYDPVDVTHVASWLVVAPLAEPRYAVTPFVTCHDRGANVKRVCVCTSPDIHPN